MNTYAVYKTKITDYATMTEEQLRNRTPIAYIEGLKNVWKFCGGRLHRHRAGYSGIIRGYDFKVIRVK